MGVSAQIVHDGQFDRWVEGLADMDSVEPEAVEIWEQATEYFYGRTQEAVHILTGDLKASGEYEIEPNGTTVEGVVSYGNEDVDYAIYELRRGGDHDFLNGAFADTEDHFKEEFLRAIAAQVRGKIS
jgi:hypothetical protein